MNKKLIFLLLLGIAAFLIFKSQTDENDEGGEEKRTGPEGSGGGGYGPGYGPTGIPIPQKIGISALRKGRGRILKGKQKKR